MSFHKTQQSSRFTSEARWRIYRNPRLTSFLHIIKLVMFFIGVKEVLRGEIIWTFWPQSCSDPDLVPMMLSALLCLLLKKQRQRPTQRQRQTESGSLHAFRIRFKKNKTGYQVFSVVVTVFLRRWIMHTDTHTHTIVLFCMHHFPVLYWNKIIKCRGRGGLAVEK